MPVGGYYHGHGKQVMKDMKARYGTEKGERVFYATANARKQTSKKKTILHGK